MLKLIIAEDNAVIRLILRSVLEEISEVEIIGEAENGRQLIKMVEELKPDAVFVDIDMPEINGIEAAKKIVDINPKMFIIFVTGFSCYAHDAFEVYAFDYVVKPFKLERIRRTVERMKELNIEREQVRILKRESTVRQEEGIKLKVVSGEKIIFINVPDIILITRNERKTIIYLRGNASVETNEPLQRFEERLGKQKFFRCHKGFIINPSMVAEISVWGNKSHLVKLSHTTETALMTPGHMKEFQERYCL